LPRPAEPAPLSPGVVTTLPHPVEQPQAPPLGPPVGNPAVPPLPGPPVAVPLPPPLPPDVCAPEGPIFLPLTPAGRPGLFGAVELGLLFPHVKNDLAAPVAVAPFGFIDTVRTPAAALDGTIAPLFTLGYRFKDDCGAVLLSYRNLASEGADVIGNFDPLGDGLLFSRLDLNTVGLVYSTAEHPLGTLWALRWEVGARLTTIFFDSQIDGLLVGQRTSNHFVGAGPTVALDVTRELPPTGLALYGRIEGTELLGRIRQRYAERVGAPDQPSGFGSFEQSGSQGVPVLGLQAGLSWLSHPTGRYRLTAGYQFEQYWAVGTLGGTSGDVRAQGLFLRTEINY
jgi:hypothetical protein